jgi:hypothetical protein
VEKSPKGGVLSPEEFAQHIRRQYSPDYAEFLLVQMGYAPRVCPKCRNTSFSTLWLANPSDAVDGKLWATWYFWCDKCLCGIYCPLESGKIPRATSHLLCDHEKAIRAALPANLILIHPDRLRASGDD